MWATLTMSAGAGSLAGIHVNGDDQAPLNPSWQMFRELAPCGGIHPMMRRPLGALGGVLPLPSGTAPSW